MMKLRKDFIKNYLVEMYNMYLVDCLKQKKFSSLLETRRMLKAESNSFIQKDSTPEERAMVKLFAEMIMLINEADLKDAIEEAKKEYKLRNVEELL